MYLLRSALVGNRIADNFDRANSNLTTPWTVSGTAIPIVSNEAGLITTAGNQTLYGLALHDDGLYTAEQGVEFRRGTTAFGSGGGNVAALMGWIHANAGLTSGAAMVLNFTSAVNAVLQIYTPTSYNGYGTARAVSASMATAADDLFVFENVGNVFTCYQNGVSRVSWTDTGGAVNLSNGRVCFGAQGTNGFGGNTGARAREWAAYDLAA